MSGRKQSEAATDADRALLVRLQSGLPYEPAPFVTVGREFGLRDDEVEARLLGWFEEGVARRFGGVFDSHSLGYRSTLCAVETGGSRLDEIVERLNTHPGVTHCYERTGEPNLWFTLTAHATTMDDELDRLRGWLAPDTLLDLPALRRFKVRAVFDVCEESASGTVPSHVSHGVDTDASVALVLSKRERGLVRRLQGNLMTSRNVFRDLADAEGMTEGELLACLRRWSKQGVLRRVGLVVRHRSLGFRANSMCVWKALPEQVEAAGAILAKSRHVSHCYERACSDAFPYNVYAMVHAGTREEATALFEALGRDARLTEGRMMVSLREFKKTSPRFFCEELDGIALVP